MNIKTKHLSNQLPLYYLRTQKAPVVTMQVWVKTGSADELENEAGLSHFIEHLVFKGTESYAPGDIARIVEGAGGELNAYTSFDQTVFYVTVPKENIEVAAKVLHEMVTSPQFDALEVDREREVVIEEIKRGFDQPSRVASQFLFSEMFKGYAYELPVIGTEENIRRVSVEEIKSYFDERYCVPNMALVCVGDIEESEVEALSEKYFSKVSKAAPQLRERKRGKVELSEEKVFYKKTDFEQTFFYYTWKANNLLHKSSNAYEVLSLLLGQGESSHLYKDLKLDKNLCQSIGCFYYAGVDEGLFVVSGTCMPDKFEQISKELPKSIESFLAKEDLSLDFQKARNIFSSEELYARESVSSLCRQIGDDWLYYNDIQKTEKRLQDILSVDVGEAKEVLSELLGSKPKLVYVSKDEIDKEELISSIENLEKIKEEKIDWQTDLDFKEDGGGQSNNLKRDEKVWETSLGNKIIYIPQPESEVCSIKFAMVGGELLSTDKTQGLVSLFGRVWARETSKVDEEKQNAILDYYCSSFGSFSGKHSIGLSMLTLNKFFKELSGFFAETIQHPIFSEGVVNREKQALLTQIKSQKDHPSAVLFKSFSENIFKDSIYARDSIGVEEHIEKLTAKDLENFYRSHKGKFVLSIVGNLEEDEINELVSSIEKVRPPVEDINLNGFNFNLVSKGTTKALESDKAQAHIVLGYRGLTFKDERKEVLDVINSILGGQGGRLFIELRDKESLAYSVSPIDHSGYFAGYFGAYIACDPSKKEKAIRMMKEELNKLHQDPLSEEELQYAKNQTLGRRAMSLQKNSYIADTALFDTLYGLDSNNYKGYNKRINAVKGEDIKTLIRELLSGEEFLFSIG